ncbi:WD40 repeat domain-containing protein [Calidithermus roseus]|uniref:WD domain, G-beta repeat n=1 Tax=Calidithermus roseus TaxID=1644118 RepID=A0A399EMA6_9DEIN|nr:WD40 repeat domain-containing protein [Calidithermus roseus]RIH84560.1 WD domain, G-beta repeat [Calidithermus roseus]
MRFLFFALTCLAPLGLSQENSAPNLSLGCILPSGMAPEQVRVLLGSREIGTCATAQFALEPGLYKLVLHAEAAEGTYYHFERAVQLTGAPLEVSARLEFYDPRKPQGFQLATQVHSMAHSPDGRLLAIGVADASVRIWDVHKHKELRVLKGHNKYVRALDFSRDGRLLASGSSDGSIRVWEVASGRQIQLMKPGKAIWNLSFDPTATRITSVQVGGDVAFWEVRSGRYLKGFRTSQLLFSASFSPSGRTMVLGRSTGGVEIWDLGSARRVNVMELASTPVYALAFSPNNRFLGVGLGDGMVLLFDLLTRDEKGNPKQFASLSGHTDAVSSLAFSIDNRFLVSGSGDRTLRLWNLADRENPVPMTVFPNQPGPVHNLSFNPRTGMLASSGQGGEVYLWPRPVSRLE